MKRKHYEEAFKREVVAAVEGGLSPSKAAEQFKVPPPNITNWKKRFGKVVEANGVRPHVPSAADLPSLEAFWDIAQALGPLSREERERTMEAVQQAMKHFHR